MKKIIQLTVHKTDRKVFGGGVGWDGGGGGAYTTT